MMVGKAEHRRVLTILEAEGKSLKFDGYGDYEVQIKDDIAPDEILTAKGQ